MNINSTHPLLFLWVVGTGRHSKWDWDEELDEWLCRTNTEWYRDYIQLGMCQNRNSVTPREGVPSLAIVGALFDGWSCHREKNSINSFQWN